MAVIKLIVLFERGNRGGGCTKLVVSKTENESSQEQNERHFIPEEEDQK